MNMLRSLLAPSSSTSSSESASDTVLKLVERLRTSTLLEDRRDSLRGLKAMSKKFRLEVGAHTLDDLADILLMSTNEDEEMIGYALEALSNLCSPHPFDEEEEFEDGSNEDDFNSAKHTMVNVGEQFSEIFLKQGSVRIPRLLELLQEFDFRIRHPCLQLLIHLSTAQTRATQDFVLQSPIGVSRLMDVLSDSREVLRNDALLLLTHLTKGHADLQKIVAFENGFDKLQEVLHNEGWSQEGGIVVEDALRLALHLLRNNPSNQTMFREGGYIHRLLMPCFQLELDETHLEVGWPAQKVSNVLHALALLRTLVSPANVSQNVSGCQSTMQNCGLLERLCSLLMAPGIPADVLSETIISIGESIRGCLQSQEFFSRIQAPCVPPRQALLLLLMSMVNEKQPFALRCAILYCLQCHLHRNPQAQCQLLSSFLPSNERQQSSTENGAQDHEGVPTNEANVNEDDSLEDDEGGIGSAGQLLCCGLFSSQSLSSWLSSVAIAHAIDEQDALKRDLLRVQLTSQNQTGHGSSLASTAPQPFMNQCLQLIQSSNQWQTRIGILMLLCTWITECPLATQHLLNMRSTVPFLTGQIGSNEHDETERLMQGLCAFLLGLCLIYNDDNELKEELMQVVERRIGFETFSTKLGEISKHEAYNRALKQPQIRARDADDLLLDHNFCERLRRLEQRVIETIVRRREMNNNDESDLNHLDNNHSMQYKELIRQQDQRLKELEMEKMDFKAKVENLMVEKEQLQTSLQTLRDQNALLRAQKKAENNTNGHAVETNDIVNNVKAMTLNDTASKELMGKVDKLEREVRIRDSIIHELEMKLSTSSMRPEPLGKTQSDIEVDVLHSQIQALQEALGQKENQLEQKESENRRIILEFNNLKAENEDLLVLLADQEELGTTSNESRYPISGVTQEQGWQQQEE